MKKINIFLITAFAICSLTVLQAQQYIEFIENKGQWQSELQYIGAIKNGKFGFTQNGYIVNMYEASQKDGHQHNNLKEKVAQKGHSWKVQFINSEANVKIVPKKQTEYLSNYYIGNNATKWGEACKSYTEIQYQNIYKNIDANYYTSNGTLKYDIIVRAGGNINDIDILYNGVNKLAKNKKGNLVLETSIGNYEEMAPYTYQVINGQKKQIKCAYEVSGNRVSYNIADYDKSQPLIIDPTIIFSTHSGSTADNWGMTATYGPDETFFGGGWVDGGGFNSGAGPINGTFAGGATDIMIVKLSANGANRLYVTYIGGNNREQPQSIISDATGSLFIYGRTNSTNFPANQKYGSGGGYDIVVAKLNANGTINRSITIGGTNNEACNITDYEGQNRTSLQYNYGDDGRGEINLDAAGNVLISSCTQSINFPTTSGALQTNFGGGLQDAAFMKFNSALTTQIFSTYFGGSGNDAGYVVAESKGDGNIYFAGGTESSGLVGTSAAVLQPNYGGSIDGYITAVNATGAAIVRTTYLGTSAHDQIYGLQFDKENFPYVMGISLGSMPVINAAYSNAGSHQFIAKLKKDLSGYEYATKFGTNNSQTNISPVAFLVDNCDNVYVSGWGGTLVPAFSNAGTLGMPITPDSFDNDTDGKDFYYFVLERNASSQLFGSFFGGFQNAAQNGEHVDGGTSRFDPKGIIYQAACASCGGQAGNVAYPVVGGQGSGSGNCNLGMTKIRFNYNGVVAQLKASDTSGCAPLNITFTDEFQNAVSYEYNYGDGSPTVATTVPTTSHTYSTPGIYTMRIIAINLASCNQRDTAYKVIKVRYPAPTLDFNAIKQPPCLNLTYRFNNLSTTPAGSAYNSNSFIWDFGDGSPRVTAGLGPQTHFYAAEGNYNVKLILNDTSFCSYPDSLVKTFRLFTTVDADFTFNDGCVPLPPNFTNTTKAGNTYQWDFGNGATSTLQTPNYVYTTPGTYTIRLIAIDLATCNQRDTVFKTINVFVKPTASFTYTPNPPIENTPTQFNNNTINATSYKWQFGDGDSSTMTNPLHQFIKTATFNTCLYATNQFGCRDTICLPVQALVQPLIDVPTALTPNGDGVNDFVIPRGFGIETINFRIFNRWGNLLFETNQRNVGWDGRYKGEVQPMDAYTYTLEAKLFDGQQVRKKGDITLIR
jgi:gliding motility-associated-like protein